MAGTLGLKKPPHAEPSSESTAPGSVATPDPYADVAKTEAPYASVEADGDEAADEEIALDTSMTSTAEEPPTVIRPHESVIAALEAAARNAQQNGQTGSQVLIYQIAVAAGALKQATGAARGKVGGEVGGVIEMLHKLL